MTGTGAPAAEHKRSGEARQSGPYRPAAPPTPKPVLTILATNRQHGVGRNSAKAQRFSRRIVNTDSARAQSELNRTRRGRRIPVGPGIGAQDDTHPSRQRPTPVTADTRDRRERRRRHQVVGRNSQGVSNSDNLRHRRSRVVLARLHVCSSSRHTGGCVTCRLHVEPVVEDETPVRTSLLDSRGPRSRPTVVDGATPASSRSAATRPRPRLRPRPRAARSSSRHLFVTNIVHDRSCSACPHLRACPQPSRAQETRCPIRTGKSRLPSTG